MTLTSQFYRVNNRQPLINMIQQDDPSYDPVALALAKTPDISIDLFAAACDRVYFDGYYGPVHPDDWKETDGRKPYSVSGARKIIARVLANVEDYSYQTWENGSTYAEIAADDIRAEIVYWYRDIYPERYPNVAG